jgi:hypothetical protein
MNTRSKILAGFTCLALWGSPAAGQEGTASLTAIRYEQQTGGSRLTLQFVGEIRYAFARSADQLVLRFPSTRLANRTGAGTLRFQDGLVRSVSTGRAGADSIVVAVVLRERTRPTLLRPSAGNVLYLDVAADPDAPVPQRNPAVAIPAPARAADTRNATAAASGSPVDIPALARSQVEERRRASETPALVAARSVSVQASTREEEQTLSEGRLAAAAMVLSVGSTIALLLFLRRRAVRNVAPDQTSELDSEPAARTETVYRMPELATVHPRGDETLQDEVEPMFDDQVQMARAFQRGKGEVGLAMALRARTSSKANRQRLVDIAEKGGSHAQRRSAARKLGVGVGEVELASQLQKLQDRTKHKEGAR